MSLSVVPTTSSSSSPKEYKILLIGETGTGKTSFMWLLLNYAKQDGNSDFDLDKVMTKSSMTPETPRNTWESDTSECMKYTATFRKFQLIIIDSPGIKDTRGPKQEEENIVNITECVRTENYINSICLIVNGRVNRLSEVMENYLKKILFLLPPHARNNVFVVCTNTADQWSANFDFKSMEQYQLIVSSNRYLYLDNPLSKYQKVLSTNMTQNFRKKIISEFQEARSAMKVFFDFIKNSDAMNLQDFGQLREICEGIQQCFAKLKLHRKNINKIQGAMHISSDTISIPGFAPSVSKNVICTECERTCHGNCNCWFVVISTKFCNKFSRGYCTSCDHSSKQHLRGKLIYKMNEIKVPRNDSKLKEEIAACEVNIKEEADVLKTKLESFQVYGSHISLSILAKQKVEEFRATNVEIEYEQSTEIDKLLNLTYKVLSNPYTVNNCGTKFRWACGMLGMDSTNITKENVGTVFRKLSKELHPDSAKESASSDNFQLLQHAKQYLERHLEEST